MDGVASGAAIVRALRDDPSLDLGVDAEDELFDTLDELCERGLATWTLEIPSGDAHPERALRRLLEDLPDEDARARALGLLERLENAREAVGRAAGDPDALRVAIDDLEATFQTITGRPPTRRAGEIYAARTLVYEDCRRDVEIAFGPELRERLGAPLGLILKSARWYTYTLAARYRAALEASHRALAAQTGSVVVDYLRFWSVVAPLFGTDQRRAPPIVAEVAADLARGWSAIFGPLPSGGSVLRLRSEDISARVDEKFAAPHPGWPSARHHSPDILVAAHGPDGLAAGAYTLVLGEVHPSTNTLMPSLAIEQHVNADALVVAREADIVEPCVSPVEAKSFTTRADHTSRARHDWHLELDATRSRLPRTRVLATGELVVDVVDDRLVVRTRDGRLRFDAIAFFEQYMMFACIAHFDIAPKGGATPRVMVDDLVVSRRKWRFSPDAIPFRHESDGARSLHVACSWAKLMGFHVVCS